MSSNAQKGYWVNCTKYTMFRRKSKAARDHLFEDWRTEAESNTCNGAASLVKLAIALTRQIISCISHDAILESVASI